MDNNVVTALSMPEFRDPPGDPVQLFNQWYDRAVEHGVREPNALAFATADERGRVWSRTIRLLRVTDEGLLFISHAHSGKGRDLARNPWASGVLYWPELKQQVILGGRVHRVSDAESERLWFARSPSTHPMSVASRQSEPLHDEDALREQARRLGGEGGPLPRPDGFCGYRMALHAVEFWHDGEDRLHLRLRYDRENGAWKATRLQP